MKIEINNDVYDVVKRIKEIDEDYFVLYNINKGVYELNHKNQENTYCLTIPYDELDSRTIEIVLWSQVSNIDNIMDEIDKYNIANESNTQKLVKSATDYMVREIYEFANNSSKILTLDSFSTTWR